MAKLRPGVAVGGLTCLLCAFWWLTDGETETRAATGNAALPQARIPSRAIEQWVAQRRGIETTRSTAADASTAEGLRVLVVDAGGAPLPATLFARHPDRTERVATTSADGTAHIVWTDGAPFELVAQSAGFASRAVGLDGERDRELTLVLNAAAQFHGSVLSSDGAPVGADAVVVVCPTRRTLSRFDDDEAWMSDPEVLVALTDAAGRYVVEGVDPDRSYDLLAGGRGWVQEDPLLGVRWTPAPVDLVVLRGYGTLVQLRSPHGRAVEFDPFLGAGVGFQARVTDSRTHFATDPRTAALLSGIVLPAGTPSAYEQLYVVGRDDSPDGVVIDLRVGPPGYEPISQAIQLLPLDAGLIVSAITLTDRSLGRGELIVERRGADAQEPLDTRLGPFALLTLVDASGRETQHSWIESGSGELRLRHVPFGAYRAHLRRLPDMGLLELDGGAAEIEVGPLPTKLGLRLENCGGLEFRLRDPDGPTYRGEWAGFIGRGRFDGARPASEVGFSGGQVLFRNAPYLLGALEPGAYSLRIERPTFDPVWIHADVRAGERTVVDVELRHDQR